MVLIVTRIDYSMHHINHLAGVYMYMQDVLAGHVLAGRV